MASSEVAAAEKPLWRRIVDFPLVAMLIAIAACSSSASRCDLVAEVLLAADAAARARSWSRPSSRSR